MTTFYVLIFNLSPYFSIHFLHWSTHCLKKCFWLLFMPPVDNSSERYMGIHLVLTLQYVTEMCIQYVNQQLISNLFCNSKNTKLSVFTMVKDTGCSTILSEIFGNLQVVYFYSFPPIWTSVYIQCQCSFLNTRSEVLW
jgi:hypothetical protein